MAIFGAVLEGIEAVRVRVTVEAGPFDVVGLSEAATRETRVRVRCAFAHYGLQPSGIVTVAREDGLPFTYGAAVLDLAVAVAASGHPVGADVIFAGELSLDGALRGIRGPVPIALLARNHRIQVVFPEACSMQLPVPPDMHGPRLCAANLREVLDAIIVANTANVVAQLPEWALPLPSVKEPAPADDRTPEWSDVETHPAAVAVREAVAAGAKVLVLVGPAGSGRTMISRRIASLLPALTDMEQLDVAMIQSAAGLPVNAGLPRPFRAPHHTASTAAIVGGGSPIRPGEITIAHHGVLLVDEANEAPRASIDALIGALKKGYTTISRMAASNGISRVTMPARPAVTVISITLPTPRLVATKDVPLTTKEQHSIDSLKTRAYDLAARFANELGATVIECPRVDVRAMSNAAAQKDGVS